MAQKRARVVRLPQRQLTVRSCAGDLLVGVSSMSLTPNICPAGHASLLSSRLETSLANSMFGLPLTPWEYVFALILTFAGWILLDYLNSRNLLICIICTICIIHSSRTVPDAVRSYTLNKDLFAYNWHNHVGVHNFIADEHINDVRDILQFKNFIFH